MRRGGLYSIGSSPVIVGALTVLITIIAVFLAYNATNGLPFVPTYRLSVLVPDAAGLPRGVEEVNDEGETVNPGAAEDAAPPGRS